MDFMVGLNDLMGLLLVTLGFNAWWICGYNSLTRPEKVHKILNHQSANQPDTLQKNENP